MLAMSVSISFQISASHSQLKEVKGGQKLSKKKEKKKSSEDSCPVLLHNFKHVYTFHLIPA